MTKKIAIVTGADKKYFPFLKNLVFSLKKTQSLDICDLCILTVDEDNSYITEINELINKIKQATFSFNIKYIFHFITILLFIVCVQFLEFFFRAVLSTIGRTRRLRS